GGASGGGGWGGVGGGGGGGGVGGEGPGQAGASHGQRAPGYAYLGPAGPRQQQPAGGDGRHSQGDASVEVLPEHDPGQQRRQHPLQVQQQGGRGGGGRGQPQHQQHRPGYPAEEDRPGKPAEVRAAEPGLSASLAEARPQPRPECQADPGAQVEQAGQQDRFDAAQQQLR